MRLAAVCLLVLLPISVSQAKRDAWLHEASSLEPDERIVWGELENGFKYALMPHRAKPGLVSMRLMVGVGSLDEKDDERGLAHFVEHMAFEGTRNFKPGELIAFFQRLGMSYGVDVNAFTYHDKTVYNLELPQNDAELVEQGLRLYRDYADGILFKPERVENERGVILREKQARDTPSSKIAEASFRFSFTGTKLAQRNPIGLEWVVKETSVEQLKAFYRKWYRPDLMTLVVVGDFDRDDLEARIADNFSSLEESEEKSPKRKFGKLARSRPFRSGHYDVDGVERYTLEVSRTWEERGNVDSWKRRETDARRALATSLFNERCRILIDGMSERFANYNRIYDFPYCQLTISSGGEFWWDAFVWLDQLLRQAQTYGFTQDELDYVKSTWLQSSRSSLSSYESAEPRMLIDDLVDSIATGRVYVSSRESTERMNAYIESLSLEEVNKEFNRIWKLKRLSYFMAGDLNRPLDADVLKRRFMDDRKYSVLPYVPKLPEQLEYTELGEPGEVEEIHSIEEVGARTYRFSNNARLTFLHTKNEKDTVRALVRIGGGMLEFRDSNPGTHALAMSSLFRSGFGGQDIEEVYKELRTNVTSFVFGVEDHDAFTYRAVTQVDGLDEVFKVVSEFLLAPNIDPEAFALAQSKLKQSRELEPDGMNEGYRFLNRLLYPDDPRFHSPSISEISEVTADRITEWVEKPFKEGYLEVAVVGDVNEAALVDLFGRTLGALPPRRLLKSEFESARSMHFEAATGRRNIEYASGMGDTAASVVIWTIQEELTLKQSASLYILSAVLESRIRERVREEMGASYSPSVRYETFPAYESLRHIRADVDCQKADAGAILDVVLSLSEELSSGTIADEELRAAVAPLEEGLKQAWQDNSYLLENVLYAMQEYPEITKNAVSYRDGLLTTITVEDLKEAASRFLVVEDALAVAIVPADKTDIADAPDWDQSRRAGLAK